MIGTAEPVKGDEIPDVNNDGKLVQAHYDVGRKDYWTTNSRGAWIGVNETSMRRILQKQGFRAKREEGEALSEVNQKLNEIQLDRDVAYAGPLAGYPSGVIESFGNRILVTKSPKLIEPAEGDWSTLKAVLTNLLVDGPYDQRDYVYGWVKFGYEALRSGRPRPGPAMVLAGPRNCGKSLLQHLFTEIFGGRVAKPYRYMSGHTDFNADLFGAEHQMVEDETPFTDLKSRRNLGTAIKAFTVNQTQSCHGKGREAITLSPFWRLSISINDEPENLMILPPMSDSEEDSLGDKIILLGAKMAQMPMRSEQLDEREAFWRQLVSELPAFLYFLVDWKVPEYLRHGRYGIRTWQHPRLLAALDALAPETRLLVLIDALLFTPTSVGSGWTQPEQTWSGTAEQLESRLGNSCEFGYEARRLLSWPGAAGTYLGRLASKHPDRVKPDRTSNARKWILCRPKPELELAA